MVFGESFETISKEEALSEVISESKSQEKKILDSIDDYTKQKATNENTEISSLNYKFSQENPDILDLMHTYWLEIDTKNKILSFEVNIPNREDWTIKWYNNYDITLTKKWASIVSWELDIPWLFNDEEYTPNKIDTMVDKIYNRILQEEQWNDNKVTDQTKENLENKMNAVKKVCKKLFQ